MNPGEVRDTDRERRALLAAMFALYAAADLPDGGAGPGRPPSPSAAIEALRRGRGPLGDRARRVATARLAVAAFAERRDDLRLALVQLAGADVTDAIATSVGHVGQATADDVVRRAYAVLDGQPPDARAAALGRPVTRSHLDVRTMMTTAQVTTDGAGTFERLARFMDPRSWRTSPFWLAADKVIRVDGRFVRDPDPPPLGASWKGYLYEYVSWAFNESVISAFQCYLEIDFAALAEEQRIDLRFSLFSAAGSMLLARIAEGGVDVDSGCSTAVPLPGDGDRYLIQTEKRIRYDDLLTRSTPNQGPPGAGQELNYMAPAIVALWMNDLTYESVRAFSLGEEPRDAHGGGPLR